MPTLSTVSRSRAGGERLRMPRLFSSISEPATMVTDYLLAALALPLAGLLLRTAHQRDSMAIMLWGSSFVAVAIAATLGGTVHGFANQLGTRRRELWRATTFLLALAADLLVVAAGVALLPVAAASCLALTMAVKLVLFTAWMRTRDHFRLVVVAQSLSLAALLALGLAFGRWGNGTSWIAAGVLACFIAGLVQQSGLTMRRLNQNDLSHLVQLVGVYLLYRGGLLLVER
jgi:uncharacterized protein DUF6962